MTEPQVLKGFRDSLPRTEEAKEEMIRRAKRVFSLHAFSPIDTPVLEYADVLLSKSGGETEKQVFRFTDNGGRSVALRFDLTVPFARFMALHQKELPLPFKRYHVAKAWRGEKPQKGRYREFTQCDFDIVGEDDAASDAEIIIMIKDALEEIGVGRFKIHVSSRALLNHFLGVNGLTDRSVEILRQIDKMAKVGRDVTRNELFKLIGDEDKTERLIEYISSHQDSSSFMETFERLLRLIGGESKESRRLLETYGIVEAAGGKDYLILDPSITRGLDYYTGVVFETFLAELPEIGSICSGGRYDDLTSLFIKERLPGVGASIGIDRLLAALEETGRLPTKGSEAEIVIFFSPSETEKALKTAEELRSRQVRTDLYSVKEGKMKRAYEYGEKRGIGASLTFEGDAYVIKDLKTRESKKTEDLEEVVCAALKRELA